MTEIPQSYDPAKSEREWAERWERDGLYRWDPSRPRAETFSVDTPPLTVSGSLHIGHAFSFTQADVLVRYQRMTGKNIAYPIGWDDNGLATERRVQNVFGIRPDPRKPYDPSWRPTKDKPKDAPVEEVSRQNFIDACALVTAEDERAFEAVWRRVGLSVDWSTQYATIDARCRRVSQLSFLDLVRKGEVYQKFAPTVWDVDDRTAVAQAEIEDREVAGAYHDLRFARRGRRRVRRSRPRGPSCSARASRSSRIRATSGTSTCFGKRARTPLFHALVPILPSEHADPEKGTGILMVCTFGDQADVEFWKGRELPLRQLIGLDGRMRAVRFGESPFESADPERARGAWAELEGKTVKQAQAQERRAPARGGRARGRAARDHARR